jgi:hypothetical protein
MIVVACAAAGVLLGVAYLTTLERNVRYFAAGRASVAVALQLGRMAVLAGVFSSIAHLGVGPLLASFGTFMLTRRHGLRSRP